MPAIPWSLLRSVAIRWAPAALAMFAAAVLAAAPATPDVVSAQDEQLSVRLVEYEALLGEPLPFDLGMCIDTHLAPGWPAPESPQTIKWPRLLDLVNGAREECASSAGAPKRAVRTIVRAMTLQVERQKAIDARRAELRACLVPVTSDKPAPCRAPDGGGLVTPAQLARLAHAAAIGRR
jgi:hypothetical protein